MSNEKTCFLLRWTYYSNIDTLKFHQQRLPKLTLTKNEISSGLTHFGNISSKVKINSLIYSKRCRWVELTNRFHR